MSKGIWGNMVVEHPHRHVAGAAPCLPCSAVWPAPSWQEGSLGWTPERSWTLLHRPTSPEPGRHSAAPGALPRPQHRWSAGWRCSSHPLRRKKRLFNGLLKTSFITVSALAHNSARCFYSFIIFQQKKNERIKQEKKYTNQLEIFWKEVFKALKSAKKNNKKILQ